MGYEVSSAPCCTAGQDNQNVVKQETMHEDSVDTALHCDLCSWGCCCECSGVSVPEARSHQFAVLRVGQELAKRGHNFTLLVSSEEALDKQRLGKRAFDGLHVVTFQGPEGIGTQEWFVNQPRDVAEVCAPGVITRLATVLETLLVMYPHTAQELRRSLGIHVTQGLSVSHTGFAPKVKTGLHKHFLTHCCRPCVPSSRIRWLWLNICMPMSPPYSSSKTQASSYCEQHYDVASQANPIYLCFLSS